MGLRALAAKAAVSLFGEDSFVTVLGGNAANSGGPRLNAKQLLKAYEELPWLRAVMDKLATAVSSVTWEVQAAKGAGGKYVRVRGAQYGSEKDRRKVIKRLKDQGDLVTLDSHPLMDVLDAGAPEFFDGRTSRKITQLHLDLIGESGWLLPKNALGAPIGIFPIPGTWVQRKPSARIPTFLVVAPTGSMEVPREDIVWMYEPTPANPYGRGSGLGGVMGDDLEIDKFAASHTKDFFRNRARPDILVTGLGVDKGEVARVEQRWLEKLQGRGKAFLPLFLNRDVKASVLAGQTFDQMQLVQLREFGRDLVREITGLPPEIFGILDNANRSTIDAADYLMQRYAVVPRMEFLRGAVQQQLVPQFDQRIILGYVSPIAEDRDYELEVLKTVPWASSLNEWRTRAGLDPLDDREGKVYVISYTQQVVSALEPEPAAATPPVPDPSNTPPGALPGGGSRGHRPRFERADSKDPTDDVLRATDPKALATRAAAVIKEAVAEFGQAMLDELGAAALFSLTDPAVVRFLREFSSERITGLINETTRQQLRDAIADGRAAGDTLAEIAQRITDVFDEAEGARAFTIGRTEIVRASNFGTFQAMQAAGLEKKAWLSTRDNRVRDTHRGLDGQVQPLNDVFVSPSGATAQFPGAFGVPEEDINCRCGVTAAQALHRDLALARWKALEAARAPFERQLRTVMKDGFRRQREAALAALHATAVAA